MQRTAVGVAGLVVLTVANLADLVGVAFVGTPGNPPALIAPSFVLGVIGLAATVPAWRGTRTAVLVVFWTRAVSTVIVLPFYVVGDQPDWVRAGLTIGIALSLVGLALVGLWWRSSSRGHRRSTTPIPTVE